MYPYAIRLYVGIEFCLKQLGGVRLVTFFNISESQTKSNWVCYFLGFDISVFLKDPPWENVLVFMATFVMFCPVCCLWILSSIVIHLKNENFQIKILIFSHFSHQNIDCGYSIESHRRSGSNENPQYMFSTRNKKIMYTPVNHIYYVNLPRIRVVR